MRRSLVVAALVSACATRSVSTTPPVWERYVSVDRDRLVVATCFDVAHTRCEERAHPLRRRGADVFALRNSTWLWPASPPLVGTTVRTRFELPAGWSVSTPWPREGDLYTMDATAMRWEGYTLLGPLSREAFTVEGTVFDVTRDGFSDIHAPPVEQWLGGAWRAVRSLVSSARPPRVQVWLRAAPGSREAVAFGLVSRGGGPSVMFFVDPDATPDSLARDWQATHELVHLVHPVFLDRDAWLREGLATWYQEVLRARSGAQTAASAWSTILEGLTLGATEGSGATLEEESASMGRTHRYHRVYWWGVAVAMTLDVTLRTESHGAASLDTAMGALYEASQREPERAWSAREAVALMERATGVALWARVVSPALSSTAYPDVEGTLRALGVQRGSDGVIGFDDEAPRSDIRDAITRGR